MRTGWRTYLNVLRREWTMLGTNFHGAVIGLTVFTSLLAVILALLYPGFERARSGIAPAEARQAQIVMANQPLFLQAVRSGDLDLTARNLQQIRTNMAGTYPYATMPDRRWVWVAYDQILFRIGRLPGLQAISVPAWSAERLAIYQSVAELPDPALMRYQPLTDIEGTITFTYVMLGFFTVLLLALTLCCTYMAVRARRGLQLVSAHA